MKSLSYKHCKNGAHLKIEFQFLTRLLFPVFVTAVFGCSSPGNKEVRERLSLAGEWGFGIDSLDQGIENKWYLEIPGETVRLPGSMAENGKGNDVTLKTDWTGDIIDKTYFTASKYERYRKPGNIKIPFWLKPVKYYKGAAWYQREFDLPSGWNGKIITLLLERPHWETTVFLNGKKAGTENSLAVAHQYDISDLVHDGRNTLSIRVDNRMVIPVGVNSHSMSDHTQSNWNGIAGEISLIATSRVFIENIKIYPDLAKKTARVIVNVSNKSGKPFDGKVTVQAISLNQEKPKKLKSNSVDVTGNTGREQLIINYPMGNKFQEWSEFTPSLYKLSVNLNGKNGDVIDQKSEEFGMREFHTNRTRFEINGMQIFLRGTTECCIFPLTGYPPTDQEAWRKVLQTCKDYGLNHVRFHSYCPPEAAFEAADRLGIYFHIECSSWANQGTSIGDGKSIDQFIYEEGDRIINEYGNHPSFCMLAYGNEPAGQNQKEYLGSLLKYWKSEDNRRVYTSAAGWPVIPENDYNLIPAPRIQQWGAGLNSIINVKPPQTVFDYDEVISKFQIPVVSHEIGQWCVYPDFKEISKYTGVLKPTNFEIFRETLIENHMGGQAEDFLMASGKLQVLCYKAEIEAALRTQGFAGFQILQLHDFPGQGTALVGVLNPFFESKGYVTPAEFRMFCSETVPIARMEKLIFSNNEDFKADIELFNFGAKSLTDAVITCNILDESGNMLFSKRFKKEEIERGNCIPVGDLSFKLEKILKPEKLTLDVSVENTSFRNSWNFWVYQSANEINEGNILVTDELDKNAENLLKKGGSVLFLTYGKVAEAKGADIAIGFSSIFWNTAWTNNQPPHTLGILCNPQHPVFRDFPTEYHSNWQWWDPVSHSQAMILDNLPFKLKPLIQPIDTWFENRRLALAFESKTYGGRLLVCSIDLMKITDVRLVSKQLLASILNYMNSDSFKPTVEINLNEIRSLTGSPHLP